MKNLRGFALFTLSAFLLFVSCSKKDSTAATTCKISSVTDSVGGSSTTYNLTYDNNGNVSTIQNGTTSKVFTYSGDLLIVTSSSGGSVDETDSIVLNSGGLMTTDVQTDASSNRTVNTYTYNASNQLVSSTNQYNGGTVTNTAYQYTNGDLTGYTDGTNTATLTYFTNKAASKGDYLYVFQLFNYGAQFIRSAHLSESLQVGSTIENFNYTFDGTGKVTSLTATSGAQVETVSYDYQCN